jgi:hypothetical protein
VPHEIGSRETADLLIRLGDATDRLVVVGGQAVNFWSWYYRTHEAGLEAYGPYTSKDIDVTAKREDVAYLAAKLGGTLRLADFDDNAPQSGTIVYRDRQGEECTLDVMNSLTGLKTADVMRTSVDLLYRTDEGADLKFRVMHPVLMLKSRGHNVLEHAEYRTDHGLRQLRAAVVCAHEYLRDMAATETKTVLKWNENIFQFRVRRPGRRIAAEHQVDVFTAVLADDRLAPMFMSRRYPQMIEAVEGLRARGT